MSAFGDVWRGLDWSLLLELLLGVIPAFICIVLHELSHGLTAYALGDDTAKRAGRLTLNPLAHVDWFGLVAMALFHFGWARPVPVNMNNFENPKRGMALTALAGPAANFVIAVVFLFLYGLLYYPLGVQGGAVAREIHNMLLTTATMSLSLGIFNLLPISPLDGSKIFFSFLPDEAYARLMRYERWGMIVMLVLVASGAVSGVLSRVLSFLLDKLWFIAVFADGLVPR